MNDSKMFWITMGVGALVAWLALRYIVSNMSEAITATPTLILPFL